MSHSKEIREILSQFLISQNLDASASALNSYESAAGDCTPDELRSLLSRYIARSDSHYKFKPQDLRELRSGFTVATLAKKQWEEVITAVKKVGPYMSVCFSHPVTNIVVSQIGWLELNAQDQRELIFTEKRFLADFESQYLHYKHGEHPAVLVGLIDQENMNKKDVPLFTNVKFAGPAERVTKVIESGIKPSRPTPVQSLNLADKFALNFENKTPQITHN